MTRGTTFLLASEYINRDTRCRKTTELKCNICIPSSPINSLLLSDQFHNQPCCEDISWEWDAFLKPTSVVCTRHVEFTRIYPSDLERYMTKNNEDLTGKVCTCILYIICARMFIWYQQLYYTMCILNINHIAYWLLYKHHFGIRTYAKNHQESWV